MSGTPTVEELQAALEQSRRDHASTCEGQVQALQFAERKISELQDSDPFPYTSSRAYTAEALSPY